MPFFRKAGFGNKLTIFVNICQYLQIFVNVWYCIHTYLARYDFGISVDLLVRRTIPELVRCAVMHLLQPNARDFFSSLVPLGPYIGQLIMGRSVAASYPLTHSPKALPGCAIPPDIITSTNARHSKAKPVAHLLHHRLAQPLAYVFAMLKWRSNCFDVCFSEVRIKLATQAKLKSSGAIRAVKAISKEQVKGKSHLLVKEIEIMKVVPTPARRLLVLRPPPARSPSARRLPAARPLPARVPPTGPGAGAWDVR